jgi:hypothetical protein
VADEWVCFAVAWPIERVARMDTSLAVVRDWLAADGATGYGTGSPEWTATRQRAIASGLSNQEGWLVSEVLVADARRRKVPGARVQERAKKAVLAVTGALEAQTGLRPRVVAPRGSTAVLGRSEVTRYAVEAHGWQAQDRVLVVEDMPWSLDDRAGLSALPVTWHGLVTDPVLMGDDGANWREYFWPFGKARPAWADDPAARHRLLAATKPLGWNGVPLRADLDEVEPYLPWMRVTRGYGGSTAWLVPGVTGVGWAFAWVVPGPDVSRARAPKP